MWCRYFASVLFVFSIALCGQPGMAQEGLATTSFATAFDSGVKAYAAKDFAKAKESFTQALKIEPHNASVLTNLALVEFQLKNRGMAIALFRHALEINPQFTTAVDGLKYALSQLEIKEVPHKIETYETLREQFLLPVPLFYYQVLTCILLFGTGWMLIGYFGKRKRAMNDETALPTIPVIPVLFLMGFVFCASLLAFKIYDLTIPRGTIIPDTVSLQAAPGNDQVILLDLHAGFEVVVHVTAGEWVQVTYPGSLTGWMKKSDLYLAQTR